MTTMRAPTVATWLLKHCGCGPNIDAVLGDLAEQYAQKSRMWYRRQVLKGIPVSIVTEAIGHKAIAAKGIVAGCITWLIFLTIYPNFVFGFAGGPVLTFERADNGNGSCLWIVLPCGVIRRRDRWIPTSSSSRAATANSAPDCDPRAACATSGALRWLRSVSETLRRSSRSSLLARPHAE